MRKLSIALLLIFGLFLFGTLVYGLIAKSSDSKSEGNGSTPASVGKIVEMSVC
ncbi:hypothetical protein ACFFGV_13065 [Pontibacillus salicampi]|uniref:Uncharacterized protein n=1 Tax=Pontibacillus salicampi TaxID=1449801 RepID=A0ABV6LQ14_9BACI